MATLNLGRMSDDDRRDPEMCGSVGDFVQFGTRMAERLLPCDPRDSEALGRDPRRTFRLDNWAGGVKVAVQVLVTGRTLYYDTDWKCGKVRGKLTFVGDGEPDTHVQCWIYLRAREEAKVGA